MKLAIICSEFNEEVTDKLLEGALEQAKKYEPFVITVPGAVEIPLTAKLLAKQNKYDAIICLGAVIRGETTHYDYVCEQVSQGIQAVMMEFEIPVIFSILTTENKAQALDRVGGKHGHKGKEGVDAAIKMVEVCQQLR